MKLKDVKARIDNYFDNIPPERLLKISKKYRFKEVTNDSLMNRNEIMKLKNLNEIIRNEFKLDLTARHSEEVDNVIYVEDDYYSIHADSSGFDLEIRSIENAKSKDIEELKLRLESSEKLGSLLRSYCERNFIFPMNG